MVSRKVPKALLGINRLRWGKRLSLILYQVFNSSTRAVKLQDLGVTRPKMLKFTLKSKAFDKRSSRSRLFWLTNVPYGRLTRQLAKKKRFLNLSFHAIPPKA